MWSEVDLCANLPLSSELTTPPLLIKLAAVGPAQPGVGLHASFEFLEGRQAAVSPAVRNA